MKREKVCNAMSELIDFYLEKKKCRACRLRDGCSQVVTGTGCMTRPILLIIAESPGSTEDEEGEVLIGPAGQTLRSVLRATGILNRKNTLMTNVLSCHPPGNNFPKDECPDICVSKWIWDEIRIAQPKRILLLGAVPLKYVAGLEGITACRGQWREVRGVRTMPTFHPSFILRKDKEGIMSFRDMWTKDINEVAAEVAMEMKKEEGKSSGMTQERTIEAT